MTTGVIRRFMIATPLSEYAKSDSSVVRALYIYGHPLVVLALLAYVGALTGIVVLPEYLWGTSYSEIVALHVGVSATPAIATRFFMVLPAAFFVMTTTLASRIWFAEERGWHKLWKGRSLLWRTCAFFGLILLCVCGAIGMVIPGDPSFCNGCTTNSHTGLFLLYGFGLPTFVAGCIAGCVALARSILTNQRITISENG